MRSLLIDCLRDPAIASTLDQAARSRLVSEARISGLLATLGEMLDAAGVGDRLPTEMARHLRSACLAQQKQARDLRYEIERLRRAFVDAGLPLILLKGAAYLTAGLSCGQGRLISDIDLLTPQRTLDRAEATLQRHGWRHGEMNAYDDRYYREWMHEIPPLVHARRYSVVDLHHTILPPTARPRVKADLLFSAVQEIDNGVFTLGAIDLVVHSATHLFHEGEFGKGLRDLWDLDRMLREFSTGRRDFWSELPRRATDLDLALPTFLGLYFAREVFATPCPDETLQALYPRRSRLRTALWDFLFSRAFLPAHPACRKPLQATAQTLLFLRGHALRMPPHLLVPHLVRKSLPREAAALAQPRVLREPRLPD